MASQEVVWECLRTQSSFLRKGKKGTPVFSAEPGNLANKHSFKFSTLANYKTVVVEAGKGKRVTVTLSSVAAAKAAGLPGKTAPRAITVGAVSGRKLLKAVGAMAAATRPDLRDAAMRRATAVQATICRTLAKANKD